MTLDLNERRLKNLEILRERKAAYQLSFSGPNGEAVLNDLRIFCYADNTCWDADARVHAALEGRREVWLRIQRYLKLPLEKLGTVIPANAGDRSDD